MYLGSLDGGGRAQLAARRRLPLGEPLVDGDGERRRCIRHQRGQHGLTPSKHL